jgi:hypothetical protein
LKFEKMNSPAVMSPWEIRCHLAFLVEHAKPDPRLGPIFRRMDQFVDDWTSAWAEFGADESARDVYAALIENVRSDAIRLGSREVTLNNEWPLHAMFESLILQMAVGMPAPSASLRAASYGGANAALG